MAVAAVLAQRLHLCLKRRACSSSSFRKQVDRDLKTSHTNVSMRQITAVKSFGDVFSIVTLRWLDSYCASFGGTRRSSLAKASTTQALKLAIAGSVAATLVAASTF